MIPSLNRFDARSYGESGNTGGAGHLSFPMNTLLRLSRLFSLFHVLVKG